MARLAVATAIETKRRHPVRITRSLASPGQSPRRQRQEEEEEEKHCVEEANSKVISGIRKFVESVEDY